MKKRCCSRGSTFILQERQRHRLHRLRASAPGFVSARIRIAHPHLSVSCNNVLLHHNGSVASMKRQALRELVSAIRRLSRKRPKLRLVVHNSEPCVVEIKWAA